MTMTVMTREDRFRLISLLHHDRNICISTVRKAESEIYSTTIATVDEQEEHKYASVISARKNRIASGKRSESSLLDPPVSSKRTIRPEWGDWQEKYILYKVFFDEKTELYRHPASSSMKTARYLAFLVFQSMIYHSHAVVYFGRKLYDCKDSKLEKIIIDTGMDYKSIPRTVKGKLEKNFPNLMTLDHDGLPDERQKILDDLTLFSPSSGQGYEPIRSLLAELIRCPPDHRMDALDTRAQLLKRIFAPTAIEGCDRQPIQFERSTWPDISADEMSRFFPFNDQGQPGPLTLDASTEHLRTEVLINPRYRAFCWCLEARKGRDPDSYAQPLIPRWTEMTDQTPRAEGPLEFDDAAVEQLDELTRNHQARAQRYPPAGALWVVMDEDGPFSLAPSEDSKGIRYLPIAAETSRVSIYGEDEQGRFLLVSVYLPDLDDVAPHSLLVPLGGLDGAAFRLWLGLEEGTSTEDVFLCIEYEPAPVFEPLVLADCTVRSAFRDPQKPWFDLVSPRYPLATLRLRFDLERGTADIVNDAPTLPRLRCTAESPVLTARPPSPRDFRHGFDLDREVIDQLVQALKLPLVFDAMSPSIRPMESERSFAQEIILTIKEWGKFISGHPSPMQARADASSTLPKDETCEVITRTYVTFHDEAGLEFSIQALITKDGCTTVRLHASATGCLDGATSFVWMGNTIPLRDLSGESDKTLNISPVTVQRYCAQAMEVQEWQTARLLFTMNG